MKDRGLTLIELVVAMAIFALVAVMGLQALTGTLRARDRLTGLADDSAELALALSMLRNDLSAAVPVPFFAPGTEAGSSLAFDPASQTLALTIGGQGRLDAPSGDGLHRVEWRVDRAGDRLLRRVWPTVHPKASSAAGPEVVMLTGVTAIGLRTRTDRSGWLDGALGAVLAETAPQGADQAENAPISVYSSGLAAGIEVTLQTARYGTLTMIEATR